MTNEDVLNLVKQCSIKEGIELVPEKAYLFNQKFREKRCGKSDSKIQAGAYG